MIAHLKLYFYKPQPMRSVEEIRADILALEQETEGLLGEIFAGNKMPLMRNTAFTGTNIVPYSQGYPYYEAS